MNDAEERLREFAEKNPEVYAQLLSKARLETFRRSKYQHTPTPALTNLYNPNELHYYVRVKTSFGTEHLLFESASSPDSLPSIIGRHVGRYGALTITKVERCSCPACLERLGKN